MRGRLWTPEEVATLARRFPTEQTAVIAADLGRAYGAVAAKAHGLGLKKAADFMADAEKSGRLTGKQGATTRFQKGHGTWNAGKKGWQAGGRAPETQFKPGQRPSTWVPVGTEVKTPRDGYWKRKISDDTTPGMSRFNWKFVHILVWEEAHGPVPAGHIVTFRDRNRDNLELSNLEMLSLADNARRNSIHRYPPELKDTFRLIGKLKREIARNEKQD